MTLQSDTGRRQDITLEIEGSGRWFDEQGKELTNLQGSFEIDISATPFTNTLTMKRLNLAIGQSARVQVTYIRLPELEISPVEQVYTRLAETEFLYEGASGDFRTVLPVDENFVVLDYPTLFHRVFP